MFWIVYLIFYFVDVGLFIWSWRNWENPFDGSSFHVRKTTIANLIIILLCSLTSFAGAACHVLLFSLFLAEKLFKKFKVVNFLKKELF